MQLPSLNITGLLRLLCFGAAFLAVLFLWPQGKSSRLLNEFNAAANYNSTQLFIKGFEIWPTGNVKTEIHYLKGKDLVVYHHQLPRYRYNICSLTFRQDDFFSTGLRGLVLLALFLFVYDRRRCSFHRRILTLATYEAGFIALFALRAFAYGIAVHYFEAATLIFGADPTIRVILLLAAYFIALYVTRRREGDEGMPLCLGAALLLSALPSILTGCRADFSNSNITVTVGGDGDSWAILVLGLSMMLWPHIRELKARKTSTATEEVTQGTAKGKGGRPPKPTRSGFTQKQVAKWFQVTERQVKRWESGEAAVPNGYSAELRQSGDWDRIQIVLKAYWDIKQSQGGDVYSAKMVLHGLSDEAMHQKRPK